MFLIRDAGPDDLAGLSRLARILNTVNLPDNEKTLKEILQHSSRSFSGKIKNPAGRFYLFVMEKYDDHHQHPPAVPESAAPLDHSPATSPDAAQPTHNTQNTPNTHPTASCAPPNEPIIVGTSQIIAQHGTREEPHIFFDVLTEERYSETIDRLFRHKILRIGFDYDGPTEIGGLVLDPHYRNAPGKLGKQLSFVRFLFMGIHRGWFRDRVLAELLPPLTHDGKSVLWEALGRHFTHLDYHEADKISKSNKEFIKNLFPSGMIYANLLNKEAQDVLGKVGPATEGVRKMLTSIGFAPLGRIDPFDGGPHFEAETDKLWPVVNTKAAQVKIVPPSHISEVAGESADGLVSFEPPKKLAAGFFRAVWCEFRLEDAGKTVWVPPQAARMLRVQDGDKVHVLAITRHMRM